MTLRRSDEWHQEWKNKRAAQLAAERDGQSVKADAGVGVVTLARAQPDAASSRPSTSGGVEATRGDSDQPLILGSDAGSVIRRTKSRLGVGVATQGSSVRKGQAGIEPGPLTPQRTSPGPAHSQGTPRGVASAARAPICERDVLAAVLELLRTHPRVAWAQRMNVGGFENAAGKHVRVGFTGCSDIIGQLRDGRFLAIEVKRPGGKATEDQVAFLGRVARHNGFAFVAWSVDDVMRGLA